MKNYNSTILREYISYVICVRLKNSNGYIRMWTVYLDGFVKY